MHKDCFQCDMKQVKKISQLLALHQDEEDLLDKKVKKYLQSCDMTKTNPEIMGDIWKLMEDITHRKNPYQKIKSYYNHYMMSLLPQIKDYIHQDFMTALKVTIAGNLIDFSAKDNINKEDIEKIIFQAKNLSLTIDDSQELFSRLKESRTLLYLGDNCGEIVLDRLFLMMIKERYPNLQIYYGVRGKDIVNDVTLDDAKEVSMQGVATVIDNGDGSLGTVLSKISNNFQKLFWDVDVVICKGQGNYEGLMDCQKEQLYFLFMVKCAVVSKWAGVPMNSIVCQKGSAFQESKECF